MRKIKIFFFICALLLVSACAYIVLPEEDEISSLGADEGWSAIATNIGQTDTEDLQIALTIRNDTANWSAMQAGQTAVLTSGNGHTTDCNTVFVSTGGHRLAPGFQMQGFTSGTKSDPKIQRIYIICEGASASEGMKLSFDYTYVVGEYNYYEQDANKRKAEMEVNLDQITTDLSYPVGTSFNELIQPPDIQITTINNCLLSLKSVIRTETDLQLTWQTENPGEYPSYVHIGIPPVIGTDGIIYGLYESPDIASVPITGAGKTAKWTTEVAVPHDVGGLHILLSVESKKQRLFVNYALNISDQ